MSVQRSRRGAPVPPSTARAGGEGAARGTGGRAEHPVGGPSGGHGRYESLGAGETGGLRGRDCAGDPPEGLVGELFGDLVRHALVPRPLPPLARFPLAAPVRGSLPGPVVRALRWAPHAVLLAVALAVLTLQYQSEVGQADKLAGGGLAVSSLLLAAVWPMLAGWLLVAAVGFSVFRPAGLAGPFPFADVRAWPNLLFYESPGRPWATAGILALAAVTGAVALRLRLRAVVCLWGCAVALAAAGNGPLAVGTWVTALFTAPMPLVSLVMTGLREARAEAAAHAAATGVERSRRMLLEERAVIARELHDVVAHHMSVVAIQAEAAPYRVEEAPPELVKAFADVRENAVAALAELRRVLGVVRAEPRGHYGADGAAPAGDPSGHAAGAPAGGSPGDPSGDPAGGLAGDPSGAVESPQPTLADLDTLITGVRAVGPPVSKTVTGEVRELPLGVGLSAYRIVQEALSNVLRHAPGAPVHVRLDYARGGLELRVVNGPPERPAPPSPGAGHGLTGMRERVAMLGGRLRTGPTEEGGFEVAGFLPAPPGRAAAATTTGTAATAATTGVPRAGDAGEAPDAR